MDKYCATCGEPQPENMTMTPIAGEPFKEECYPCRVGGVSFGKVPMGTDLNGMSVRQERDTHKRMAEEAGHEWVPIG